MDSSYHPMSELQSPLWVELESDSGCLAGGEDERVEIGVAIVDVAALDPLQVAHHQVRDRREGDLDADLKDVVRLEDLPERGVREDAAEGDQQEDGVIDPLSKQR